MPPRRSARKSTDKADTPTPTSTTKKRSSRQSDQSNITPRPAKQQKKTKAINVTPKTSPHFKKARSVGNTREDDDQPGSDSLEATSDSDSLDNTTEKEDQIYSDSSEAVADSEFDTAVDHLSSDDEDDSDDFTEDEKPKPKTRKAPAKGKPSPRTQQTTQGELWRVGADIDLEPGTEIIIKKPKARLAGKTPYKDDTIHPNTMLFLKDLKANNDRGWLKMHDPDYRASLNDWTSFVEQLTEKLTEIDETIPELPVKDIVFRIYRDIRFSKDPTPYKTYYSAAWSRTGRKGPYAAYYLQIAPGSSFIGGGCWFPEAQYLAAIRNNINRRPHKLKNVLSEVRMRKEFLGNVKNDTVKVVQAFVSAKSNAESALKTKPKGYEADHRDIDLLRLKSFTIGRSLHEDEITKPDFMSRIVELMTVMEPFVAHLNSVVMPDGDESDSDDPDDSGSEAESDAS